jgi:hypothetical protein
MDVVDAIDEGFLGNGLGARGRIFPDSDPRKLP